jgi:aspartate aminotransferase-like enzyme/phosphoserine phosphatase
VSAGGGFRSVVIDFDSTLVTVEGIDLLAGSHADRVAEMTDRAMAGAVPLEAVYGARLELIRPDRERLAWLGARYVETLVPHARETVAALRWLGKEVRIMSGGLLPALQVAAAELGLERKDVWGVAVRFDETGRYGGYDEASPLARAGGKGDMLEASGLPVPGWWWGTAPPTWRRQPLPMPSSPSPAWSTGRRSAPPRTRPYVLRAWRRCWPSPAGPPTATDSPLPAGRRSSSTPTDSAPPGDMTTLDHGTFFLPGPTEVHRDVLQAMTRQVIPHRGRELPELLRGIDPRLRALFRTSRPVIVVPASATAVMEMGIRCGVRRSSLSLTGGAFGERFADIAERCERQVERYAVEWGEPFSPDEVLRRLRAGDHDAVTVVHSETSTGVLSPVREIAEAVRQAENETGREILLLVDGVSSVGGAPVETDGWGLDFLLTGSQKALALPPGLAFGTPSERLLARARTLPDRGRYLDLLDYVEEWERFQTPTTPAVNLLYALGVQLERIEAEGVERRWERHAEMAAACHRWVEERAGAGLGILAPAGGRSPTVTTITLPAGLDGPGVAERLAAEGFAIAPGYGKLKERTIRVGHMGDHSPGRLAVLLEALDGVLVTGGVR